MVADAASRGLLDTARQYAPHAAFYKFYPPSTLLGGPSKRYGARRIRIVRQLVRRFKVRAVRQLYPPRGPI
jgi:hypothetical protein